MTYILSLEAEIHYHTNKEPSRESILLKISDVKNYKPNVYVIENYYLMPNKKDKNFYFAWDSKYKTMVELDKDLNIISKITRKITGPAG